MALIFNIFDKSHETWSKQHICSDTSILPPEFFSHSPFGISPCNPPSRQEKTVATSLNTLHFRQLGFPNAVVHDLNCGIPLLMHTVPPPMQVDNYSSVFEHDAFSRETLDKWKQLDVYEEVDKRPHIVSPLGVVSRSGKCRLIVDATASGLNDTLYAPKFRLPSHSAIVNRLSHNDYLAKADFKNGFLQLPIREVERTFLGFLHPFSKRYCVFRRLPFGLGPATFLFQTFSEMIRQCLQVLFMVEADVYIDDWLFWSPCQQIVEQGQEAFYGLCNFLGVTINPEKSEGPLQALNFLGLRLNTQACTLELPEVKRQKYHSNISTLLAARHPLMDDLAQIAGQIVHVAAVHTAGWAHVQPLWDALYENKVTWTKHSLRKAKLTLSPSLRDCLEWWQLQLQQPMLRKLWKLRNGKLQLWDHNVAVSNPSHPLTITTDASSSGWGASCGISVISGTWTPHQQQLSNNWRETRAVLHAIEQWSFVRGTRVLCLTDNCTTVAVVNARRPAAAGLVELATRMTIQIFFNNCQSKSGEHLPTARHSHA